MSHYHEQLERIEEERAAVRARANARDHAALDRAIDSATYHVAGLNRAIAEATPIRTRDILAAMTAAVERIAIAVERISAIPADAPPTDTPADWPDAPTPAPPPTYTEAHRRQLIHDLHELCWPQCAISQNEGDRTLFIRLPNSQMALEQVSAALGHIGVDCLRALLASFPCYAQDTTRISITFPARWMIPS